MHRLRRTLVDQPGRQQLTGAGQLALHGPGKPEITGRLRGADAPRESDLIGDAAAALAAGHLPAPLILAVGDLEVDRHPRDRTHGRIEEGLQLLKLGDLVELVCGRTHLGHRFDQMADGAERCVLHEHSQPGGSDNLPRPPPN